MIQNRRKGDEIIQQTYEQSKLNTEAIHRLEQKLDDHIKSEEPILAILEDVAAVGRVSRWVKGVILWFTVVGGALYAGYEAVIHLGKGGGH